MDELNSLLSSGTMKELRTDSSSLLVAWSGNTEIIPFNAVYGLELIFRAPYWMCR